MRRAFKWGWIAGTALVLAACTAAPNQAPSGNPSFSLSPASVAGVTDQQPAKPAREAYQLTEFPMGGRHGPHDVWIGPDGLIWTSNQTSNTLSAFDPAQQSFRFWDVPSPRSGPHGLMVDSQNRVWFTEISAHKLGLFDVASGSVLWERPIPTRAGGPHTPIADGSGLWISIPGQPDGAWFTEQSGDRIGFARAADGDIREFAVPTRNAGLYGITWAPDGSLWFAELTAHQIGHLDPSNGAITEYRPPTPSQGARRVAVDAQGRVWFTEFIAGQLGMYDPASGQWWESAPPTPRSQPYAIAVDRWGVVWFSEFEPHQLVSYDPENEAFTEYHLPPSTGCRTIVTDADGAVWCAGSGRDSLIVLAAR